MAATDKTVKFWRGSRAAYNALGSSSKLDYWTRYTVTEPDGSRTEYFGSKPIDSKNGELMPVIDILPTLPSSLNVGDRYLIGHDATGSTPAEYYIVEIAADLSESTINPFGNRSVRVINRDLKAYVLVDGAITTYDQIATVIDCGTF